MFACCCGGGSGSGVGGGCDEARKDEEEEGEGGLSDKGVRGCISESCDFFSVSGEIECTVE